MEGCGEEARCSWNKFTLFVRNLPQQIAPYTSLTFNIGVWLLSNNFVGRHMQMKSQC